MQLQLFIIILECFGSFCTPQKSLKSHCPTSLWFKLQTMLSRPPPYTSLSYTYPTLPTHHPSNNANHVYARLCHLLTYPRVTHRLKFSHTVHASHFPSYQYLSSLKASIFEKFPSLEISKIVL